MAAQKLFVEVQDEQGNIYYVHTSSDVVFCADGETVEEKLKNATTEKDGRMSAEDKKKLDGIAEGANKYVHPTGSGNKHIPSGGSAGQVLRWSADGTAVWGADKDTTYTAFKAATSSAAGGAGLVPAPAAGNHDDYLRGDGKWGAASDMVQTFSQASSRTNITSGEANKTIFGKVMKWFADLGVSGIAAFAKVVNNGTTTVANTVLDGRFGKTLLDRIVAAEKNITTINSALTAIIGGLPSSSGGRVEFTAHEYPAGEFLVDGEKSTYNCSIAYMRLYFANERSILIGAMFGTSDPDWWSKYVATSKILVSKNIGSEYFGWTSI